MSNLPLFATVRQQIPNSPLQNIPWEVRKQVRDSGLLEKMRPGSSIAIGVGSRGIADLKTIVRALVDEFRACGLSPFIFPAMGSHGGGTAEGQREVLRSYGVTEEVMGCPIKASMEVVQVGMTKSGVPAFCCAEAYASDGIVIVNRIKVHTDFHGPTESGLTKMLAIGLGKKTGAERIHERGVYGLRYEIPEIAAIQIERSPMLFGLGIIEDGCHQVHLTRLFNPKEIPVEEPKLLEYSRSLTPKLPIDHIDLLIVDEMGKEISGSGLDTNVIGRLYIEGQPEPETPRIKVIVVRRLSQETHGNATGIGLADIVTRQLLDAVDFDVTHINVVTSGFLRRGEIPIVKANDYSAIQAGIELLRARYGCTNPRIVHIKNTLSLSEFHVSENLLPDLIERADIEVDHNNMEIIFDDEGNMITK